MANETITGKVTWNGSGDCSCGEVRFDQDSCHYCGQLVTSGVHAGQVAVTISTSNCDDVYYADVDWTGTCGTFKVSIPDNCCGGVTCYLPTKVRLTVSGVTYCYPTWATVPSEDRTYCENQLVNGWWDLDEEITEDHRVINQTVEVDLEISGTSALGRYYSTHYSFWYTVNIYRHDVSPYPCMIVIEATHPTGQDAEGACAFRYTSSSHEPFPAAGDLTPPNHLENSDCGQSLPFASWFSADSVCVVGYGGQCLIEDVSP